MPLGAGGGWGDRPAVNLPFPAFATSSAGSDNGVQIVESFHWFWFTDSPEDLYSTRCTVKWREKKSCFARMAQIYLPSASMTDWHVTHARKNMQHHYISPHCRAGLPKHTVWRCLKDQIWEAFEIPENLLDTQQTQHSTNHRQRSKVTLQLDAIHRLVGLKEFEEWNHVPFTHLSFIFFPFVFIWVGPVGNWWDWGRAYRVGPCCNALLMHGEVIQPYEGVAVSRVGWHGMTTDDITKILCLQHHEKKQGYLLGHFWEVVYVLVISSNIYIII